MLISPMKKGTVHNPTPASIFEDIMRKPPSDYISPKIPSNADAASKKKLFDLCWYDSLIEDKNKAGAQGLPHLKFRMKRNSHVNLQSQTAVTTDHFHDSDNEKEVEHPEPNSHKTVLN